MTVNFRSEIKSHYFRWALKNPRFVYEKNRTRSVFQPTRFPPSASQRPDGNVNDQMVRTGIFLRTFSVHVNTGEGDFGEFFDDEILGGFDGFYLADVRASYSLFGCIIFVGRRQRQSQRSHEIRAEQ